MVALLKAQQAPHVIPERDLAVLFIARAIFRWRDAVTVVHHQTCTFRAETQPDNTELFTGELCSQHISASQRSEYWPPVPFYRRIAPFYRR